MDAVNRLLRRGFAGSSVPSRPRSDQSNSDQPPSASPSQFLRGWDARVAVSAIVVLLASLPVLLDSPFWMNVMVTAGAYAAAAIGLNILTGYTGQVSLGHAAFLTIGGYAAGYFGASQGWTLVLWLGMAAVCGAIIGGAVGPFALRVKGDYLVVVSLALLFITSHVVENWESVTGGHDGISVSKASLAIGPVDFGDLRLFGMEFSREEGLFYLAWLLVGIFAVIARNIMRSRPGRALQAVRDRDTAAEVLGVSSARYKIAAFVLSSAMAATAGGVIAVAQRFLTPNEPLAELFISIQFVAIIVVGGVATIYGSVLGAVLLVALPEVIKEYTHWFDFTVPLFDRPLVSSSSLDQGLFNTGSFSNLLFGLLLVGFLLLWPRGIAGWLQSLRALLRRG